MAFTLAHLSDPHIGPLPPARLAELAGKRFLGWLSWQRRRRRFHLRDVLDALVADLAAQAPDHVAVTGDLTNIALPAEFAQAADWLKELGTGEQVSVVPGNHDACVPVDWERGLALWQAYMSEDEGRSEGAPQAARSAFPYVRRRENLAIVGLSTALPTPPGSAAGALGPHQLNRLEKLLAELGREGAFRCVLLHHPPIEGLVSPRKALRDGGAFRRILASVGAELVLHGHDHDVNKAQIQGPRGGIPVIGVPSASARGGRHRPSAQYNLYSIERGAKAWQIGVQARGLVPESTRTPTFQPVGEGAAPLRRLEVPY